MKSTTGKREARFVNRYVFNKSMKREHWRPQRSGLTNNATSETSCIIITLRVCRKYVPDQADFGENNSSPT